MQNVDEDVLYAIFKSMPPTEENLQKMHMWSKSNRAFKNAFDRLVSDKEWMQVIRKENFLKKIDDISFNAVAKSISELDVASILAGVDIYIHDIEILQKISELLEKLTCEYRMTFSREKGNLIGRQGGIQKCVTILEMYPAPWESDCVHKIAQLELHMITCKALENLLSYSDQNRQIFIDMNGIEILARVDKLGMQYYDTEKNTSSYMSALWQVLPCFGRGNGVTWTDTNKLKKLITQERIMEAYRQL